ncbi:MAG: 60S ribosomal protein L31 [Nanoarchaeota archaeon]|nr:60S ribosomal protein L31 [Nanoarchaeota archaeon]
MERLYTIPLRKAFLKSPRYKRTAKSIRTVKIFIQKHMKNEDVRIGKYLNLEMWKHGRKNPPSKIQVKATTEKTKKKDIEIEYIKVELPNAPVEKVEEKKKTIKEKLIGKKEEVEEKKEEIKEESLEDKTKEDKKEVLTHHVPKQKHQKEKAHQDKTVKSQQKKISSIIGQTGKK